MKKTLLFLILISAYGASYSQDLRIFYHSNLFNGDTIFRKDSIDSSFPQFQQMSEYVDVGYYGTADSIGIRLKREVLSYASTDVTDQICWAFYCNNEVSTSGVSYVALPDTLYLDSNEIAVGGNTGFTGYYNPKTDFGTTLIKYTFFNIQDTTDNAVFYIEYTLLNPVGLKENSLNEANVKLYPNPTSGVVSVQVQGNITSNAQLIVHDITGKEVRKVTLTGTTNHSVDFSNLNQGIYFYQLKTANKVTPLQKLVITH